MERINQIRKLQKLGFSLSIIKEILQNQSPELLQNYFNVRMAELDEEKEQLAIQASTLTHISDIIREDMTIMNYDVVAKELPERDVASIRQIVPTFGDEGKLWEILYAELQKQEVQFASPPLPLSIYHDKEYKELEVDIEVQVSIKGKYSNTSDVTLFKAPRTTIVSSTFHGSYDQMPNVTQSIAQWITTNHYEIAGPMLNIFHVSPAEDLNPNNWITEAAFIVKKIE